MPSCAGFNTTSVRAGSSALAAAIDQSSIGRPARGCSTFGSLEFIRTPLPAARTTTVTRGSDETARLDPAEALARMGGIAADYTRASCSGSPVVGVEQSIGLRCLGREPPAHPGAHPVKPPAEPVAISVGDVFHRQIR